MSSVSDGLSSYFSLTSKINALKNQKSDSAKALSSDPDEALLSLKQQELGKTLDLTSSSEEEDAEKTSDFFSFFLSYINARNQAATAEVKNTTNDEARLLYAIQMVQSRLNLNI
jgi:hypothetical protein